MRHSPGFCLPAGVLFALAALNCSAQPDSRPLQIAILSPSSTGGHSTSADSVTLQGTVSGQAGVSSIRWQNRRGQGGAAEVSGASWQTGPIPLIPGKNPILVTAVDSAGHRRDAYIVVFRTTDAPPDVRKGVWRNRVVSYTMIGGRPVYEGDIVLDHLQPAEAAATARTSGLSTSVIHPNGASIAYPSFKWSKVGSVYQVPYVITGAPGNIAAAIAVFNSTFAGVIQYVPQTTENDFVNFALDSSDTSLTCYSEIGHIGGSQAISGSYLCGEEVILHEMGHSVGLYHEQSRTDRDNYVTIHYANIGAGYVSNFDQVFANEQDSGSYDLSSIMHYSSGEFSATGQPTIDSIPPGIPFGNLSGSFIGYSEGDIDTILRLYDAAPTAVTISTNPQGLQVIVDGSTVTAPQVYHWAMNSTHTLSVSSDAQGGGFPALTFGRWSDSGDQTHTITITPGDGPPVTPATSPALTVYTANFIDFELFTLTVTPTGAGTVTTTPPAQTFAAYPGRQYLRSGQPVTLQANAAAGYQFLQWSGIETPSSENPITRTYAQFVGVQFVTTTNPVYTFASNPVGEWVYLDGAFTWVPQNVSPDVTSGWGPTSVHTLSADASEPGNIYSDTQNTFLDWSDGGALSHSITLPAASKTYTADFDRQYPLFLSTGCGGSATTAPSSTSGLFDAGSTVSLSATPTPGWFFAGWTGGDVTGTTNPIDVTMNSPHYAAATFNATAAPLTITGFSPSTAPAGGAPFTLTIVGTGFTAGTQVSVNYSSRSATLVDSSHITVSILTSDLVAGGIPVSVSNVSPDNSCSNYSERPYLVSLPASVNSIAIKAGNGQSATVNQPFLVALQALVTDSSSKPVAGAPVVFTAPASGASGTFVGSLASVTVTTDSSGTATAPTFTANGTAGSYSVTAAVGTASVSFSLTNTAVVTGGGPVSDDFHSATLNTSLWTFINPEGDGQYTMTGIELQLTVPAGTNHDPLTPSNQSVRVVQSIPNQDFGIEVKFDSVPVLKYQMEGVLVEQDASNYLRFEFSSNGSSTSLSALSVVNGVQTTRVNIPVTFGTSAWMRVIRSGSSWTVEWTGNGTNFIAEPAFTQVLNVARTGPYAGNYGVPPASPPAFFALVDYFFNMASPIVPEDGGPPVILNKQPTVVGPTTAIFTFNTDVSSIGTVTYGLSAPTGNSVSDTTATTTHSLTLTNLTCATTYHYVISATAGGQTSSQPAGTFTTGACLQAPVADTFNVPQLNTAVWSVESSGDPISAGTVSENGTELVLSIPAAVNHDPFVGGDDALRVVQTIANADFRVEAKFDSIPTKKYQIEGITVEQDQRNYLRFEISSDGTSASVAAASIVNSAQTWWFSNRITLSGPSVWLRVSRTGSSWTLAWSASGTSFTTAGTFTQSLQAARIGPYAGNYGSPASAAPAFAASVDYFNNAFGPVVQNVQPDDFDDYAKSNTLWTYVNPVDNAGLVFNGTDVYITALGHANHDPFAGGDNSARLVQPVSNPDFNVELKFDSLPTLMYQMEGLLVEQDGTNYVRFEVSTDGTTKHLSAAVVLSGAQTVKLNMPVVLTGSSVWMRVARAGANWTLTRSADGNTYSAGVSFTQTLTVNRLGPYAGNYAVTPANAPEFMIAVDYIHTLP